MALDIVLEIDEYKSPRNISLTEMYNYNNKLNQNFFRLPPSPFFFFFFSIPLSSSFHQFFSIPLSSSFHQFLPPFRFAYLLPAIASLSPPVSSSCYISFILLSTSFLHSLFSLSFPISYPSPTPWPSFNPYLFSPYLCFHSTPLPFVSSLLTSSLISSLPAPISLLLTISRLPSPYPPPSSLLPPMPPVQTGPNYQSFFAFPFPNPCFN